MLKHRTGAKQLSRELSQRKRGEAWINIAYEIFIEPMTSKYIQTMMASVEKDRTLVLLENKPVLWSVVLRLVG